MECCEFDLVAICVLVSDEGFSQPEYGSPNVSEQRSGAQRRKRVLFALCGSALLLAVIAVTQGQAGSAPISMLAQAGGAAKPSSFAAKGRVAIAQAHLSAKAAAATGIKRAHTSAVTDTHSLTHVPEAAIKSEPSAAHPAIEVLRKKAISHAPAATALPAAAAHPALSTKQQRVRASMVKGQMMEGEEAESTPAPAADAAPAPGDAGAAVVAPDPTDVFHSPVGDLKPTGIMAVFFNENVMITAVGIIAFLLLAICCFARNADCALT